jgi:hypothetical protein
LNKWPNLKIKFKLSQIRPFKGLTDVRSLINPIYPKFKETRESLRTGLNSYLERLNAAQKRVKELNEEFTQVKRTL